MKKRPWTPTEDDILVDYIDKKGGKVNWNTVPKETGLQRGGKNCRLRWVNQLMPKLKKGKFTAEEEQLICELHGKFGNKWAQMASYLPGHTDNEIKNYWNTRIKKCHRTGLPLYPPEILQEIVHGQSTDGINGDNKVHPDSSQKTYFDVHDSLKDNQGILPYVPDPDPLDHHIQDDTVEKLTQSFGVQSPLDPGPSSHSSICYSHSLKNGNSSTSKHFEAVTLPSLRNPEIDLGGCGTSPPPPLPESNSIQCPSFSGLLQSVRYQQKTLSSSNSSTAIPAERADNSAFYMYEMEWEDYADPVSPSGASSKLNECPAVIANRNLLDEQQPVHTINGNIVDQVWTPDSENQITSLFETSWSDFLIDSECYEPCSEHEKNQSTIITDVTSVFLED